MINTKNGSIFTIGWFEQYKYELINNSSYVIFVKLCQKLTKSIYENHKKVDKQITFQCSFGIQTNKQNIPKNGACARYCQRSVN